MTPVTTSYVRWVGSVLHLYNDEVYFSPNPPYGPEAWVYVRQGKWIGGSPLFQFLVDVSPVYRDLALWLNQGPFTIDEDCGGLGLEEDEG